MLPKRITVHCSATPNGKDYTVDQIRADHISRGFEDIGYHFVIYPDGSVHVGRSLQTTGAHVKGANKGNIGICLIGTDKYTAAQFYGLRQTLRLLFETYDIVADQLFCHYQFPSAVAQGKTCPNIKAYDLHSWYFEQDEAVIKKYLI